MGSMTPMVSASISMCVNDGCPIEADVYENQLVSFVFDSRNCPADIGFDLPALRRLVEVAQRGLAELEKRVAAEDAAGEPLDWPRLRLRPESTKELSSP